MSPSHRTVAPPGATGGRDIPKGVTMARMNSRLSRTADASQARVPLCLPATCLLATCLLASGLGCGRSQPAPEPDMVLLGGKIVTVDSAFSYAEAVAIRRVFGDTAPPVTGFKWAFGHLIAAAGILEAAVGLAALARKTEK